MAIVPCPYCGGKVSDKAFTCVHCGGELSELHNHAPQPYQEEPIVPEEESQNEPTVEEQNEYNVETYSNASSDYSVALIFIAVMLGCGWCLLDINGSHLAFADLPSGKAEGYYITSTTVCVITMIIVALLAAVKSMRTIFKILLGISTLVTVISLGFSAYYANNPSELIDMDYLARFYYDKRDFKNAVKWCTAAANSSNESSSRLILADAYLEGRGVNHDYKTAMSWYKKVLDFPHNQEETAYALFKMGIIYQDGLGVAKDNNTATQYFNSALSMAQQYKPLYTYPDLEDKINARLHKQADDMQSELDAKERDEARNLSTIDLSAFLLHGCVKTMTSYSGQCFTKCTFNEAGRLIKYELGDNHETHGYKISHNGNELALVMNGTYDSWGESYEVRGGKLVKYESGGDGAGDRCTYSNFDANNWPLTETVYEYYLGDDDEADGWRLSRKNTFTYTDIDEYGNWRKKLDASGSVVETRDIEYHPIMSQIN